MRKAVQEGESALAADIADLVDERLLPSATQAKLEAFGSALAAFNRLNGAWYAAGQDGAAGTAPTRLQLSGGRSCLGDSGGRLCD
jgi:predicted sugar kinase